MTESPPKRSFHCRSRLPCELPRGVGALIVLVAVQLSVPGLYRPPVFKRPTLSNSAPDDHFTAGPDCRVIVRQWVRWWCWWLSKCPCWDCISRRYSNGTLMLSIRPKRSFHCRSTLPCEVLGQRARW